MKQKTEIMKSILILTVILPTVLLLGCIIGFQTDNGEPPKLVWVYTEPLRSYFEFGQPQKGYDAEQRLCLEHHYSTGFLTGYTAYARIKNEAGSGGIEIRAMTMRGSDKDPFSEATEHFDVEEGRNYTLVIEGSAQGEIASILDPSPHYSQGWDLIIESPSADSRWKLNLEHAGELTRIPSARTVKTIRLTSGH